MSSKIKSQLSPEQVVDLLHTLAITPGGEVLRVIQAAAKKRGINVSLMGASAFRDEELKPFLDKLKFARAKSQALAEAVTAGDEAGLLGASRTMLAEKIADVLMAGDRDMATKELASLSKALQQLTSANTGSAMADARLREFEAKEEARQAAKTLLEEKRNALVKKGGLSKEAIELMEEQFTLLG